MERLPKINILFEDNHLIVVEKPVNIPVQEDSSKDIDLLTILKNYIKEKYNKPGNVYLGLVHRLDRPVGGIMVFAKTSKAASRLSNQVRNNEIKKTYHTVVKGNIKHRDRLVDFLIKDNKKNMSFVTTKDKGKESILEYVVVKKKDNFNLIKVNLITGRSHQIRVQFSSRGFPLVGDQKYNKHTDKVDIALFCNELSFYHPVNKEYMIFKINLPKKYPFSLFE